MASGKSGGGGSGDGAERRSHPRHPVTGVTGSFLFSTDGRILNLSLDGVALETSDYLQVGRVYSLKLAQEDEELLLKGRVVWCRMVATSRSEAGEQHPLYNAGVQFEELMSDTAREVHRFLGSHAVISVATRLFGRFKLHRPETANLDYQASFQVDKISLSGMEVRSDTFVDAGAVIDLELRLRDTTLTTVGRVVHSRQLDPEPGVESASRLGIEFLEMDDSSEQAVKQLIREAIR
jgi:hypothetical protein